MASQLAKQPEQGVEWLSSFWRAALKMTDPTLSGMDALSRQPSASAVLSVTLTRLLTEHDNLSASTLLTMLLAADKVLNKEQMAELCATALGRQSISKDVRLLWQLLQFLNSPTTHPPPLIEAIDDKQVSFVLNILGQFEHPSSDEPAENKRVIARFIIDLAGPLSTPSRDGSQNLRRKVCKAINQLSSDLDTEAVTLLQSLIENPKLRAWQANLRHALSDQTRLRCDQNFIYPSLSSLHEALAGPAPVNAADLFAIAIEELRRLQRELHTVNTTPWKRYWNSDRYGEATEPLIENECRNHLLERLKDRFTPYKISAVPEAQSREERRVDILLLAGGEGNLPIEAKRHFHQEVWLAASSQLQEYATAAGADGYGIFLVFWFGSDYKPTPALPDNSTKPNSAELMEAMLIAGLPEKLRRFTEIIVFDVSNKGGNKNK